MGVCEVGSGLEGLAVFRHPDYPYSMSVITPYDDIPYESQPRSYTHPDCLATWATLHGMTPAPITRCRVLELGCGTGGNLLPMAATLPESRFLGVDQSGRQIAMAQQISDLLGLNNVTWQTQSILDLDESLGTFDYIVCHGVYSWVPPAVQEKILALCRRQLAPQGVAYISYNTYPGWHARGMVREMLTYHVQDIREASARVAQARTFLSFLAGAIPDPDTSLARAVEEERNLVADTPDYYIFHEHLEACNQPLYFSDFMRQAEAAGLQFLSEAAPENYLARLRPEVQAAVQAMSANVIQFEQYLDFLFNRTFRRTLLCRADVALNRSPSPARVAALLVSGRAHPEPAPADTEAPAGASHFRTCEGTSLATSNPLLVAALTLLHEAAPQAIPFADLLAASQARAGAGSAGPVLTADVEPLEFAAALLRLYVSRIVALHTHQPRFTLSPGARPRAFGLARLLARTGLQVSTLCHVAVELAPFERAVLAHLDGTCDRPTLIEKLAHKVTTGELTAERGGQPVRDLPLARQLVEASLEEALNRLARAALLEA